jgi:hypothetical protein
MPPSSPRNGYAVVARGAARLRGVSKDRHRRVCGHPSRLAEGGEHLRMTIAMNLSPALRLEYVVKDDD